MTYETVLEVDNPELLLRPGMTATAEIVSVIRYLRDEQQFVSFIDVTAVDWPGRERRFDVVYHLLSPYKNQRVRVKIEVGGLRYTATIGRFPDGRIGEIFLSNTKPSSQSDVNARDAAVATSLAFQFGCPLETLRRALLRDSQGRAASPLGASLDFVAERQP